MVGEIAARRDPPDVDTAEQHYRTALSVASESGMRPLIAHCQLGVAVLYRGVGEDGEAREHLTIATTMYREMDMRFYLDQAAVVPASMA